MRELIIQRIKDLGWLDFYFKRGDHDAYKFKGNYEHWLRSLDDKTLLATYDYVTEADRNLD